jgi:hypothetical protein
MVCVALLVAAVSGRAAGANWRVIPSDISLPDVVVAGCDVRELGAKGDGAADDTTAFTTALNQMSDAGGGTVFVPAGSYVIRGNLVIPFNVTLRGVNDGPHDSSTGGSGSPANARSTTPCSPAGATTTTSASTSTPNRPRRLPPCASLVWIEVCQEHHRPHCAVRVAPARP